MTFDAEIVLAAPLPEGRYDAIARLTKGAGTRGDRADVLGLAVRLWLEDEPWDVLFSSAGQGRLTRWVPRPARDWGKAGYSTLAPYENRGRHLWLRAVPREQVGHASVSELAYRTPDAFTLSIAGRSGGWSTAGRLTLGTPLGDSGERFDPILNCPSDWRLTPGWLRKIRELAYQGSRIGRKAGY